MSVHGQTVQARYWGNSNFHFIRSREVSYVNSYHPPGLRGTFEKKPNKRVRTKKSPQFGTSLQKCHVTKAKSPLSSLSQVFLEHCQGNKNVHTGSYIVDLGRRWRATTKNRTCPSYNISQETFEASPIGQFALEAQLFYKSSVQEQWCITAPPKYHTETLYVSATSWWMHSWEEKSSIHLHIVITPEKVKVVFTFSGKRCFPNPLLFKY